MLYLNNNMHKQLGRKGTTLHELPHCKKVAWAKKNNNNPSLTDGRH